MTETSKLLTEMRAAHEEATKAVRQCESRLGDLQADRSRLVHQLTEAKAIVAASDGSADLLDAMDQAALLEARLKAFDTVALPAAQKACNAARASIPCARQVAALALRERVQSELSPLYADADQAFRALDEILGKIEEAHATLRQDCRPEYPTLWSRDPRSAYGDILRAVPPKVRAFMILLFNDAQFSGTVFEDRFLTHDADALDKFAARLDMPASEADLAKFNGPVFAPPAPIVSTPPQEHGPAKMHGYEIREGNLPPRAA